MLCPGHPVRAPHMNAKTNPCFFCPPRSALEGELNKQGRNQDLLQQSPAVGNKGTGTGRVRAQAFSTDKASVSAILLRSPVRISSRDLLQIVIKKHLKNQICIEPEQHVRMKQQPVSRKALESSCLNSQQVLEWDSSNPSWILEIRGPAIGGISFHWL